MKRLMEIALRDTCVLNYRRSYDRVSGKDEWEREGGRLEREYRENASTINALVKVALIITDDKDT